MRAEIITDSARLAEIGDAWADLFARVPDAPPFLSPLWLLPWWETFAPGALRTVAVWDGDRLAALAPLYREDGAFGRRLLPLGIGLSDMLDLPVDPELAEEAGRALLRGVAEAGADCDAWSAEECPPGAAVLALPDPPGWRSVVSAQSACPQLDVPPAERLREAIPPRQWRKWQMARHRAERRAVSISTATPATLHHDLDHLFRLHGLRWASRGESGVLADARVRQVHMAAAAGLLAAGLLRLTVLRLDGLVAGVCYGLRRGGTDYAYLGGFDPAFAFESPGTLLIGDAIAAAAERGALGFSFLRGQETYKYGWGATDRWNHCRRFEPIR